MKELGEYLKEARVNNGVSLDEVSEDLNMDKNALENIESGNVRAFKDMYVLKELVKDYSKYLGLDTNHVVEEFNDFLYCLTSKIDLNEIENSELAKKIEEKKITSPYTNIPKEKKDYSLYYKIGCGILLLIMLILIFYKFINKREKIDSELKGRMNYEFTYKINNI